MGTTSATRRHSFALAATAARGHRQLLNLFVSRRPAPLTRPALFALTAALGLAGCLAPELDTHVLSALLLVLAAASALVATMPASESTAPHAKSLFVSQASAPRRGVATLHDLQCSSERALACDKAHWHRLTHRMSHELRTPLNAVLGFSELMTAEVFGPLGAPQYADYAKNINASGRILLKSAEDALAITNLLTGLHATTRNPVASVQGAFADMVEFHAAALATTTWELPNDCSHQVVGEPQTLRQILINLMAEALHYAGEGVRIVLSCSKRDGEIDITLALAGPNAARAGGDSSFAVMLARSLTLLSHARFTEQRGLNTWSTTVTFPCALQRDFFAHEAA